MASMRTTNSDDRVAGSLYPNGVGIITIDRPKALNAADKDMVLAIHNLLKKFNADPACRAVAIEGSTARSFCSGGDVKAIAVALKENGDKDAAGAALGAEYNLICDIANMKKPYIAFMDGVVMGFGVGLCAHGRYRIVTEKTVVAMPENVIGLGPDIGFAHAAKRAPKAFGLYLGLTGARVRDPSDLLFLDIGSHFVPSDNIPTLREALLGLKLPKGAEHKAVKTLLEGHEQTAQDGTLANLHPDILRCFDGKPDVAAIITALEADVEADTDKGEWAPLDTLEMINSGSPTTLAVTHRHFTTVAKSEMTIEDVLRVEYALCVRLINDGPDFVEGVRAALIDKDRQPKWSPSSLAKVTTALVNDFFEPLDMDTHHNHYSH